MSAEFFLGGGEILFIYSQISLFSLTVLGDSKTYGNMMVCMLASQVAFILKVFVDRCIYIH